MQIIRSVAKNISITMLGSIATSLIGIVTVIKLTRYLGANNLGIYSFIFVYLGFFGVLIDLGISRILVREISRDRRNADKLLGNAIVLRAILSCAAIFLAFLIINFMRYPLDTKLLVYVASLSFLMSVNGLYVSVFQVNLRMEYPVVLEVLNSIIKLGLFLYLIYLKMSLFWFVAATVVASIPGLLISMLLSRRFIRPKFQMDLGIWRWLLKESWPLALTGVLIMIYLRVDQLMLFQMKGAEAVGYYAAVVKLAEMFNVVPAAFMATIFPLFSAYFVVSLGKLEKAYELCFKYMSLFIMPIAIGIFILSQPIINAVYGERFAMSVPALRVIIWSEIFVFLGVVHLSILISAGLQKFDLIFTSTGAVVNVVLNFLLIPRYGIVGASIATVVSYSMGIFLSLSLKKTQKFGKALVYSTFKPLIAGGLMGLFTYLGLILHIHLVLNIIYSAIAYFGFILLIRGLDQSDAEYFKQIVLAK